jgi:hypothetical protein
MLVYFFEICFFSSQLMTAGTDGTAAKASPVFPPTAPPPQTARAGGSYVTISLTLDVAASVDYVVLPRDEAAPSVGEVMAMALASLASSSGTRRRVLLAAVKAGTFTVAEAGDYIPVLHSFISTVLNIKIIHPTQNSYIPAFLHSCIPEP